MRVTEDCKAVGAQRNRHLRGPDAGLHRLIWHAIDQVEVDAGYSIPAKFFDGTRRLRFTLDPVDSLLNDGIETLHTQACAGDAGGSKGFGHFDCERARVDLDGDRSWLPEVKSAAQEFHEGQELGWRNEGRRSAAEMHVAHGQRIRRFRRHQADLLTQDRQIIADRRIPAGAAPRKAAIPADRAAERNVDIERHGLVRRQAPQPFLTIPGADRRGELRYCWIDGVPGHAGIVVFFQD